MTTEYSFEFDLYAAYTKKNIIVILETGRELGFVYWNNKTFSQHLIYQIVDNLYVQNKTTDCGSVTIKIENTRCTFMAYQSLGEKNALHLSFFNFKFGYRWDKEFEIGMYDFYPNINVAKYIELFLKLLKDFDIKKIEAGVWD